MNHRLLRPIFKAIAILGGVLSAIGGGDITAIDGTSLETIQNA